MTRILRLLKLARRPRLQISLRRFPPLAAAFAVFLIAAFISAGVIWELAYDQIRNERAHASLEAANHANALEHSIERSLSATYALAALVREGSGAIRNFDAVASQMLPLYPGATSLQLAPRGIVQRIVPLAGNEPAIGHDLLKDPARTAMAFAARDTGKLTLDGPFALLQGGMGAVGRLPVFLESTEGPAFWGFTSVVIRFPAALAGANFIDLSMQDYAYQLWRTNPVTGHKQVITASSSDALIDPVQEAVHVPNANWTLSIAPVDGWGQSSLQILVEAVLALLFSALLGFAAKLMIDLRAHKRGLEALVSERTAELVSSEARFRALTEMSSDFYWESDGEHRLTQRGWADKAVSSVLVFQQGAQFGQRLWDAPYLSPDEAGWQAHRAVRNAHLPFRDFQLSRPGADGSERYVSLSGDPLFDGSGAFLGYRGVGTDITSRKHAQQALRASEDGYRDLVENSQDLICTHDLEGKLLSVNAAAARITGYSSDALLRMNLADLVDPATRDLFAEYLKEIRARGKASGLMRILTAGGERRWWEYQNTLRTEGVPAPMVRGTSRDVTERMRAEKKLRAAEGQFRGLIEQSIAGSYIIQDGKFAYVNPRFAEIFGYGSADELIGVDASALVVAEDRGKVADSMRRRIEGEVASINYEFTGLRKDGSTLVVGVHGTRAAHSGRPAVIGLVQDISEKKRADEQIARYIEQLRTAFTSTVEVAMIISEMRDPYTVGHERRVAQLAVAIGAELGFDADRQEGLRVAGSLHDVGKITIPAEILSKPGRLSAIEMQLVQIHPQAGYDVLKGVQFPWPVAEVALQHHERIDGSGYPQGLKGEAIIFEARIMAVADVVEAMSSHRPYRAGLGIDKALAELERGRGTAYDASVADACLALFRDKGYVIPA